MAVLRSHGYWIRGIEVGGVQLEPGAMKKARKLLHGSPVYGDITLVGDVEAAVGRVLVHGETLYVEFFNQQIAHAALKHQRLALQVHTTYFKENKAGVKIIKKRDLVLVIAFLARKIHDHQAFEEIPFFEEIPAGMEGTAVP